MPPSLTMVGAVVAAALLMRPLHPNHRPPPAPNAALSPAASPPGLPLLPSNGPTLLETTMSRPAILTRPLLLRGTATGGRGLPLPPSTRSLRVPEDFLLRRTILAQTKFQDFQKFQYVSMT